MQVKTLVITGFGLNCEVETKAAFENAGSEVTLIHFNDLIKNKSILKNHHILAFIGGFSFGDHLGSGTVFANKVNMNLNSELKEFINDKKLIIGICNGFQTMVRLGILPGLDGDYMNSQKVALAHNDSGQFRDDWVNLVANQESPCVFTKGIETIELPIRHGEGKFIAEDDIIERMENSNLVALRYADSSGKQTSEFPANPNGSINDIAGVCDPTGRIFGLMPHPEAFLSPFNYPHWKQQKETGTLPSEGQGTIIFKNAVNYIKDNF